jgi:hypothetical protein
MKKAKKGGKSGKAAADFSDFPVPKRGARRSSVPLEDVLVPEIPEGHIPILAIDPGITTGVVVVSVPGNTLYGSPPAPYAGISVHVYEEIKGEDEAVQAITDLLTWLGSVYPKFPVVIEDFSLRMFSRSDALLSPVRLLNRIKEQVHVVSAGVEAIQLFFQQPATAKTICTDARLERWGLLFRLPGGKGHARDALRHAVALLRRCAEQNSMRDLAWGKEGDSG